MPVEAPDTLPASAFNDSPSSSPDTLPSSAFNDTAPTVLAKPPLPSISTPIRSSAPADPIGDNVMQMMADKEGRLGRGLHPSERNELLPVYTKLARRNAGLGYKPEQADTYARTDAEVAAGNTAVQNFSGGAGRAVAKMGAGLSRAADVATALNPGTLANRLATGQGPLAPVTKEFQENAEGYLVDPNEKPAAQFNAPLVGPVKIYPSSVGAIAGGGIAGVPMMLNPALAGPVMGSQMFGEKLNDLDNRADLTTAQKYKAAIGQGLVGTAAGEVGGQILSKLGPAVSKWAGQYAAPLIARATGAAADVAGNAAVGGAQHAAGNFNDKITYDPDRKITEGVPEAAGTMALQASGFAAKHLIGGEPATAHGTQPHAEPPSVRAENQTFPDTLPADAFTPKSATVTLPRQVSDPPTINLQVKPQDLAAGREQPEQTNAPASDQLQIRESDRVRSSSPAIETPPDTLPAAMFQDRTTDLHARPEDLPQDQGTELQAKRSDLTPADKPGETPAYYPAEIFRDKATDLHASEGDLPQDRSTILHANEDDLSFEDQQAIRDEDFRRWQESASKNRPLPDTLPSNAFSEPVKSKPANKYGGRPWIVDKLESILSEYGLEHEYTGELQNSEQKEELEKAGGNIFHFSGDTYPGEIKRMMENVPGASKVLRLTKNTGKIGGGRDALSSLGDDVYEQQLRAAVEGNGKRVLEAARKNFGGKQGDDHVKFLLALHENTPARYGEKSAIDPSDYPSGTTFKIHGEKFEIAEDEDGYRVLKDGESYPIVPADAVGKIPHDTGSVEMPESENSEAGLEDQDTGDFLAGLDDVPKEDMRQAMIDTGIEPQRAAEAAQKVHEAPHAVEDGNPQKNSEQQHSDAQETRQAEPQGSGSGRVETSGPTREEAKPVERPLDFTRNQTIETTDPVTGKIVRGDYNPKLDWHRSGPNLQMQIEGSEGSRPIRVKKTDARVIDGVSLGVKPGDQINVDRFKGSKENVMNVRSVDPKTGAIEAITENSGPPIKIENFVGVTKVEGRASDTQTPRDELGTGVAKAGGKVGLFGQAEFDAKRGAQETFGFKQASDAVRREERRNYAPEIERRELPETEAQHEAAEDKETAPIEFKEPTAQETQKPEPKIVYINGDKAEVIGIETIYGGEFDKVRLLEGPNKGAIRWQSTAKEAAARVEKNQQERAEQQESFGRLAKSQEKPAASREDLYARNLRKQAESLAKKIEQGRRESTQNPTPKRMRQERQRRVEADILERQQKALNALADAREAGTLPKELASVTTRKAVEPLVAKVMKSNGGYYDAAYETSEYRDKSPQAKALQELLENKTPEENAAEVERAKNKKISDLEDRLRFQKIPGFFPTPKPVIERMMDTADIQPGDKVLEPSAGKGDIADAVKERGGKVDAVESLHPLREILEAKGHNVAGDDALQHKGQYDKIVMNPPFENGQDIDHVRHAFEENLKPGGKLVAIMSEGPFGRSDKKATAFRDWLAANDGHSEKMDAGSFAGKDAFRQTGVATRMVEINKPEGLPTGEAEAPAPPDTGKLDQLESWASDQLKKLGGTGLRGGIPFDPIKDPQRIALHAMIAAAKIAKGAIKLKQWTQEMVSEYGEQVRPYLGKIWSQARRLAKMSDGDRAEWAKEQFEKDATEAPKQATERSAGIKRDPGQAVRSVDVLRGKLAAERRGAAGGWRAAMEQGRGLRNEMTRIIGETLPTKERGPLMRAVAQADTLGKMRIAIEQTRRVLADMDLKNAFASVEKLVGHGKLDMALPPLNNAAQPKPTPEQVASRQEAGIKRAALREIDINEIDPAYRERLKPMIDQLKTIRQAMKSAKTIDDKYRVVDAFKSTRDQMSELLIQHYLEKTEKIGKEQTTIQERRADMLNKLATGSQIGQATAAENVRPKDRIWIKRWATQRAATPQTLIHDIDGSFGNEGPLGGLALRDYRRAKNNEEAEVGRFDDARSKALEDAGYATKTRKFQEFIGKTEPVDLPNAGRVNLTRSQQAGLYSMWSDPETRAMIEGKGRARFNFRTDPAAEPFEMTPDDFDRVGQRLTPAEKNLKDGFFDKYNQDNLRDQSVRANFDLKGLSPETHEGYFPRRVNMDKADTLGEPVSFREQKRALENIGQMQQRQNHDNVFYVPDFIGDTDKFIRDSSGLIHSAKIVRSVRMMLEHPDTKTAIRNKYGPAVNRELDRFLLNLTESPDPRSVDKRFIDSINRQFYRAQLTLAPRSFMKNVVGGTSMVYPFFDHQDYFPALRDVFDGTTHKEMTDNSAISAARWSKPLYETYGSFGRHNEPKAQLGMKEALRAVGDAAKSGSPKEFAAAVGKTVDSITLMNVADAAPFNVAYSAAKREVNRLHPDWTDEQKKEAILDRFHDVTMRTQNGMTPTETSGIFADARTNPLLKAITFLRSDVNKKLNLILQAKHADRTTRAKIAAAVGFNQASDTGIKLLLSGTVVAGLAAAVFKGTTPQKAIDRAKSSVMDAVGDSLGIVPGGDAIFDAMQKWMRGDDSGAFNLAPLRAVDEAGKGIGRLVRGSGNLGKNIYSIVNSMRALSGDPTLPITNDAVSAMQAWQAIPPDPRAVQRSEKNKAAKEAKSELDASLSDADKEYGHLAAMGKSRSPTETARMRQLAPKATQARREAAKIAAGK